MDDSSKALQAFLDIISLDRIISILLLCLIAWLFLVLVQFCLNQLNKALPKYRLIWSRSFPFVRLFVWLSVIIYSIVGIIDPHENLILAVVGSISIVVGLATQEPAKNMISGFIMMINPPYRVGDMISVSGYYGEVTKLEWSVTWIRTFDDNTVMVPNAEALKTAVSNANSGALDEMVVVSFTIPIHADHKLAIALAKEATQCSPYTLLKKPIIVNLGNDYSFGQYQQTITVKAYVMDVRLEKKFMSDINIRVLSAFKNAHFYDAQQTVLQ
ncbi:MULTISPECIES: mechanosensitive ion channel family protein [Shewanella]|uniref:Small-conductance mechanosensitive channel n=1 Tax=Shewanella polaris TaxID=2588449 RepID=A0A4Y5YHL8_9GAMM|nr:mechanosensitive ion channel domain-containing protein [Shewanella polaris]QDE32291.1 mechanosensitive ion channel [Shewanella polaris]